MDAFALQKSQCLERKDQSKRGMFDRLIKPLLLHINEHPDYYTTSSCAGRIVLIAMEDKARKCDARWLYITHGKAMLTSISKSLNGSPKETVWLRQESFIMHVAARDLDAAGRLIKIARDAGLKHSGICSLGRRIMLEIGGNEIMETPIYRGGLLITEDYLRYLIKEANVKMVANAARLRLFTSMIKKKI
jgi:tRNA wybutosine-synthesizing protein 3